MFISSWDSWRNLNSKYEYRNTKQIRNYNDRIFKTEAGNSFCFLEDCTKDIHQRNIHFEIIITEFSGGMELILFSGGLPKDVPGIPGGI